ncbi:MAG TPA: FxLYD domain-containing protein [Gemmatimonadaceae bacterium]
MKVIAKAAIVGAAMLAASAPSAGAQEATCTVDVQRGDLGKANKALAVAQIATKPADKKKNLSEAVRTLSRMKDKSAPEWNFLLGQALGGLADLPETPAVATRGSLGFTDAQDVTVDVLAAADSAFTAFETARPECKSEVVGYRQRPWVNLVNAAIQHVNADQNDSAAHYARRSLVIYRESPYAYNVLAAVAQRAGDKAQTEANLRRTIETAGEDTTFADIKKGAMLALAGLTAESASSLEGDAAKAKYTEAAGLFRQYLAMEPKDPAATAGLGEALLLAGDSAAYDAHYKGVAADAANYSDVQLFRACTEAVRAERNDVATALCEAGVAKNPYYRDGLYVLATAYYSADAADKMMPVAQRLVAVDPSNPDSYQLLAGAFQLKQKVEKDAKAKRALTDSVVAYMQKAEALPGRVSFTRFAMDGAKRTLVGSVQNSGKAQKSFTVKIEFLDKAGNVVATQEATVGPVKPQESAEFTVTAENDAIIAYRYAPLS